MSSLPSQSVLFFRIYREVTMPLYAAMITELCASPHLPFELATTLEDIGQEFIRLADEVNVELRRRGLLDREADPDDTVEAKIEGILKRLMAETGQAPPRKGGREPTIPEDERLQQALRTALTMTYDLPVACAASAIR